MKSILIAFCLSFFTLGVFADDAVPPQGAEPVAPVAEPTIAETPSAEHANPMKREVARKRKHRRGKKHRKHRHKR